MHFEGESKAMARLNDNLFTALLEHAVPGEFGCRLLTRFGVMRAIFNQAGLSALTFEDGVTSLPESNGAFYRAFLDWLRRFQGLPADEQWTCLALGGTEFQKQVWRALLDIPLGETTTYAELAVRIGRPTAHRAVGTAVGANPACLLVPCHRVLPAGGGVGNYHWGSERKRALLDAEAESGKELVDLFQ